MIFVYCNHLAACIMYSISYYEYWHSGTEENLGHVINDYVIEEMKPVMEKGTYSCYINFLFWAITCSSSGSYGDIWAVAVSEKIFQILTCLFFRIYIVFLFSEISHVTSTYKTPLSTHLEKVSIFETWMKHNKISHEL